LHYLIFPFISKLGIVIHKIIRWNSKYGFIKIGVKVSIYTWFIRLIYAGLFAFSIATLISSFSGYHLFRAGTPLHNLEILFICEDIFLGTFLITPLVILIFFPIWQMEDLGFISYKNIPDRRMTPDIEGVHALIYRLLKGYAGLSTIISLGYYIYMAFSVLHWDFSNPAILTPLILIVLPFLVMGLLFFPVYLYELYLNKSKLKIEKYYKNFKIIEIPDFEKLIK